MMEASKLTWDGFADTKRYYHHLAGPGLLLCESPDLLGGAPVLPDHLDPGEVQHALCVEGELPDRRQGGLTFPQHRTPQ